LSQAADRFLEALFQWEEQNTTYWILNLFFWKSVPVVVTVISYNVM
jgi:hypothetical protein